MTLKEFIENNDVDFTKDLIGMDSIPAIEKEIGVSFGAELVKYIVKYGYLAFEDIEFYGINSKQNLDSDMVKQTIYLHTYFQKTVDYIALGNQGEGHYHVVSADDMVYEYISSANQLIRTEKKLLQFILERFQAVHNN